MDRYPTARRQRTYTQQTISLPAEQLFAPKKNRMEQPQRTPPESRAEDQSRPPEEVVHELVEELERLLESGQWPEALERFSGLHPVDQGEVLDGLPRELRQSLLAELDHSVVADILEYLEPEESAEMVGGREPADLAQVLDLTDPDVAVDLLQQIPEEKQQETLEAMADAAEVTELLRYQDDTAGGLMITDYPVVTEATTTPNALDQLRLLGADTQKTSIRCWWWTTSNAWSGR